MAKLLLIPCALLALGLAACGGGGEERWGGYTEEEARDVLADPHVRQQIIDHAPGDPVTSPFQNLVPTSEEAREADLTRKTVEGREAWEYRDAANDFCIYIWHEEEFDTFGVQPGVCAAD